MIRTAIKDKKALNTLQFLKSYAVHVFKVESSEISLQI